MTNRDRQAFVRRHTAHPQPVLCPVLSALFPVQSHHGFLHTVDAPTAEKLHISTETTGNTRSMQVGGRWQVSSSSRSPKIFYTFSPQIQLVVELLWPLFLFFILVAVRHSHPPLEHHECESHCVWWDREASPALPGAGSELGVAWREAISFS